MNTNNINLVKQKKINDNKKLTQWIIKNNKPHKNEKIVGTNILHNELIVFKNVNKFVTNGYSNVHILKDINLKIKRGEFVVIYGPSGSGKTTLLSLISALDRPTSGFSYLFGKNTISLSNGQLTLLRKNYVGYIFQQYGLLKELSVYDNVKITQNLQMDKRKRLDVNFLLKEVGLLELKNQKASSLSGGQSQRVAICRALVKNPEVLFGDEPTGAVHIDATKQILNIFKNINKSLKTTIILVTHNEKILQIANRVIKVEDGRIVADYQNLNIKNCDEIDW